MRLADAVLRQGHLSEQALTEAAMTGNRSAHLDRCEICADRAVELGRWLDGIREATTDAADRAFPAERLLAQQAQIMRRLEQADEPSRVIAFPANVGTTRDFSRRRVAPAWIGVATAAGIALGVGGTQMVNKMSAPAVATPAPASAAAPAAAQPPQAPPAAPVTVSTPPANPTFDFDQSLERLTPAGLQPLDEGTPMLMASSSGV